MPVAMCYLIDFFFLIIEGSGFGISLNYFTPNLGVRVNCPVKRTSSVNTALANEHLLITSYSKEINGKRKKNPRFSVHDLQLLHSNGTLFTLKNNQKV